MNSIYGNVDDLFLFCTVVEEGSLLSASKRLQLPVSTMSRRLTALEDRLNVRLLEKQGRELVATADGELAFAAFSSGMESIQSAFEGLLQEKTVVQGTIKLAAPHNFYTGFLSKTIETFLTQYPKVQLDLVLSQEQIAPQTDRDLLMTFDISALDGMIARPLFKARHGFFASPEYISSHSDINAPSDLENHDWVCVDQQLQVPVYHGESLKHVVKIKPKLIVNDIRAVAAAVEKGIGIASLPFRHVLPEMNLIQLLPEYHRSDRQAYLVYKERKYQPKALTLLIDALIEGVRSFHHLAPVK
ncbi:LysR family transcriptional regulator [Vibrio sp. 99-70-13A1]|uniref:LysR family transcriptional regulator n=1 Tax=Vibrio sp. 99-70-13A1 TaxID=2607601 RepID=UPI0014935E64|nr:LysR family transcriptional regulator [Vibrio sp. 99-70-13A1]NOH95939.1 LysR family transcriptional regulator [Vibrio sp. 99-70-13A1]